MSHKPLLFAAALASTSLLACTDDPQTPPVVDSGSYFHYVQSSWKLPTAATAATMSVDLDDDGTADNRVADLFGMLSTLGLDPGAASTEAFASGDLVILHSVRADALDDDDSVSWHLLAGNPSATRPRFDGKDSFTAGADGGTLLGALVKGKLTASYGNVTLRVPLFAGQYPLPVPIDDARIELDLSGGGCKGTIAGVISSADRDAIILPILSAQLTAHVGAHPEQPFALGAVRAFDTDRNGAMAASEVTAEVAKFLTADIELDDDGKPFSAGDGVSIGLGFDCAKATFTATRRVTERPQLVGPPSTI